jgi:hypothetical protein
MLLLLTAQQLPVMMFASTCDPAFLAPCLCCCLQEKNNHAMPAGGVIAAAAALSAAVDAAASATPVLTAAAGSSRATQLLSFRSTAATSSSWAMVPAQAAQPMHYPDEGMSPGEEQPGAHAAQEADASSAEDSGTEDDPPQPGHRVMIGTEAATAGAQGVSLALGAGPLALPPCAPPAAIVPQHGHKRQRGAAEGRAGARGRGRMQHAAVAGDRRRAASACPPIITTVHQVQHATQCVAPS